MTRNSIERLLATGLAAAVTFAAPAALAGRVKGPVQGTTTVQGKSSDVFHDVFRGGEQAVISVVGNGATDLDVYVYDEFGNLIAQDEDDNDRCVVTFTPKFTGMFRIEIRNLGEQPNEYEVSSN